MRRLATVSPQSYAPGLAKALLVYSATRQELKEDSTLTLTAAEEAVAIYERLAGESPGTWTDDLAAARAALDKMRIHQGKGSSGLCRPDASIAHL